MSVQTKLLAWEHMHRKNITDPNTLACILGDTKYTPAHENFMSTVVDMYKAFIRWLRSMWLSVKDLFKTYFTELGMLKRKLKALMQKANSGLYLKENHVTEVADTHGILSAFKTKSTFKVTDVLDIIHNLSDFTDSNIKAIKESEVVGKYITYRGRVGIILSDRNQNLHELDYLIGQLDLYRDALISVVTHIGFETSFNKPLYEHVLGEPLRTCHITKNLGYGNVYVIYRPIGQEDTPVSSSGPIKVIKLMDPTITHPDLTETDMLPLGKLQEVRVLLAKTSLLCDMTEVLCGDIDKVDKWVKVVERNYLEVEQMYKVQYNKITDNAPIDPSFSKVLAVTRSFIRELNTFMSTIVKDTPKNNIRCIKSSIRYATLCLNQYDN